MSGAFKGEIIIIYESRKWKQLIVPDTLLWWFDIFNLQIISTPLLCSYTPLSSLYLLTTPLSIPFFYFFIFSLSEYSSQNKTYILAEKRAQ